MRIKIYGIYNLKTIGEFMKRHKIALLIFTIAIIGICYNIKGRESYAYTVREEHPRIYINSDNIGAIRARAGNGWGVQDEYYLELKNYADSIMEPEVSIADRTSPQRLKILAFLYVLGEIPGNSYIKYSIDDYGNKGIAYLKAFADYYSSHRPSASYGSIAVQSMSVAYDWLYHKLTQEDKQYIVPRLIKAADGQRWNIEWPQTFKDYSIGGNNYCIAGLAFYGDKINYAKEYEYLEHYIKKYRQEFIAGWDFATEGGGSFQGSNGHFGDITIFLYVMDAFYTATDIDDIGNFDYLKYASEWLTYALVPHWNNGNNLVYTDNDFMHARGIGGTEIEAVSRITSYPHFSDRLKSLTAWLVDSRLIKASPKRPHWTAYNYDYKLMDLVWRDSTVEAKSPKELNLPLARHFGVLDNSTGHAGGVGIVIMKSAWEDADATFAMFKCAPFKYTHDDHDSNSFIITKKGLLAIDSGLYENGDWWNHELNYAYRTIAHNSMLIFDPKENFGGFSVSNDGGQRLPQRVYSRNYPKDFKVGGGRDIGGMVRFESVEGIYDYMRGDATRAYQSTLFTDGGNKPKISLFTRDFVYLRSKYGNNDYFVVFDKVNSTNPEFKKKWLLHSIEAPMINGTYSKGGIDGKGTTNAHGGTSGSISYDTDTVIISEADGKLFSRTLLPIKRAVIKVGGPDVQGVSNAKGSYESYVNGVNYKTDDERSQSYKFNPLQGSWRIEVESLVNQKEDLFLHVLYPCDKNTTEMPQTILIESQDAKMTGTLIVSNVETQNIASLQSNQSFSKINSINQMPHWVVLFSKTGEEIAETQYKIHGQGASRHLLCDVKKNAQYEIWQNGEFRETKQSSDQGTLFFEGVLEGSGEFLIREKKGQ